MVNVSNANACAGIFLLPMPGSYILCGMKANLLARSLAAFLLLSLVSIAAAAPNPPLPTPADIREMFKAGQYRTCLQQIARVLQLSGDAAKPYDLYALLLLRGDCLLQLDDKPTAMIAYAEAEKSPDVAQAAAARAMTLLLRRSNGKTFVPPGGGQSLNILDAANRKKAMSLLFDDGLKGAQPEIRRALDSDSLVPSIDLLPRMRDLYALERTASGTDAQSRPILMQMGEHCRELIMRELALLDQRISATQDQANQNVNLGAGTGQWWWGAARRGLHSSDRDDLRAWIEYANKIQSTAQNGRRIAIDFGGTGEKWDPVISKAVFVAAHAEQVLAAE